MSHPHDGITRSGSSSEPETPQTADDPRSSFMKNAPPTNSSENVPPSGTPLISKGFVNTGENEVTGKCRQDSLWSLHLLAPIMMITTFVLGIAFSLGHHFYYTWLDGQIVLSTDRQQWALRFGNVFAFLAKVCFCSAAQIALTQWLWRTLRREYISIRGIDAAFSLNETLLSFLNLEMLLKIKVGALLAIVIWCIPLIALVTPATLSVKAGSQRSISNASVPVPIMPQYLPMNPNTTDLISDSIEALSKWASLDDSMLGQVTEVYLNENSPQFSELIQSTASTGKVFAIPAPFTEGNSSYSVEFIAPKVKCEESSSEVARNTTIAAVVSMNHTTGGDRKHRWINEYPFNISGIDFENLTNYRSYEYDGQWYPFDAEHYDYFAMIPFEGAADPVPATVSRMDKRQRQPERNELWAVIADHDSVTKAIKPVSITCQLWNATWKVDVTTKNNIQTVHPTEIELLNSAVDSLSLWQVRRNDDNWKEHQIDLNKALYTTFFAGIAKPLLGHIVFVSEYGIQQTDKTTTIGDTVLTGSNEYVAMFQTTENRNAINTEVKNTLKETNKPLKHMIEEYAQNLTLNLMTSDYFSTTTERPVHREERVTVYTYEAKNLFIAYGIATICTLLAISTGVFAFMSNGVSYNSMVSTIIRTTQNPDIKEVVGDRTLGCQPLAEDIAQTKLRFGVVQHRNFSQDGDYGSHIGFGVEGTVSPLRNRSVKKSKQPSEIH